MVVHAALDHAVERTRHHLERASIAADEKRRERPVRRELGRTAEATLRVVEIALGLALAAFALRRHARGRLVTTPGAEPAWLTKLDRMGPIVAFAFGTFMINVVFVVDAGLRIAAADPELSAAAAAVLFYAVLSTASLIAVLAVYFGDRAAAERRLATMRAWIARNNANVTAGMLGAVGIILAVKGIVGLLA
jgi:hypothetical protein